MVRNSDALISDRMLCYVCEHKLELHRNLYVRNDYEHEVYSAYSWTEVNEILVRNIVRGLKGGGAERLFAHFAETICELRWRESKRSRRQACFRNNTYVIPAPRRGGVTRDHGEELGFAVAQLLGAKYAPILARKYKEEQKSKSLIERKITHDIFSIDQRGLEMLKSQSQPRVIFVDDIVTTGRTAHSAYMALGQPMNFEIWAIFNRIRLRP
ncbi:MAG: phosphoribosyltransferase [Bdellovibrionales bacterium]|nr:phosphoribosyltransferase [Bdellovibrionales bacterium]